MLAHSQPQALTYTRPAPAFYPASPPCYHLPEARSCVHLHRDHATSKAAKCPTPTATTNLSMNKKSNRGPNLKLASNQSRRTRDHPHNGYNLRAYSHDSLPPNFATLIAITSIPPLKKPRPRGRARPQQTVGIESDFDQAGVSEKIYDYAPLRKDHLEILLRSPDSDFNLNRDYGIEPVPSLSSSLSSQDSTTPANLNADELSKDSSAITEYKSRLHRGSPRLKPQSCLFEYCLPTHHPLAELENDAKTVTEPNSKSQDTTQSDSPVQNGPKTKLTLYAPFRAMKAATRKLTSISSHSSTSRELQKKPSLRHPYTTALMAENILKSLEDTSTQTFSKYSNPFCHDPLEEYFSMSLNRKTVKRLCISSIQLQTYHNSRSPRRMAQHKSSQRTKTKAGINTSSSEPFVRPREMRENGDFMRVAVMEMLMRKRGKLDRQSPGRARMALPPRKVSTEPYEISSEGIPVRWLPISC
ncbi:BgTH12-06870 [Blumeria graminis f. sp. triticale]|uniref:BgTH12-06870 n=1 Tax=Blumeria graminis f. sp. triticale TaxID=1689686 RepID=A0A9W4D805_BLUGR|nr:BgTH12-06870 [Blumeria graminis f. sp. triticale]